MLGWIVIIVVANETWFAYPSKLANIILFHTVSKHSESYIYCQHFGFDEVHYLCTH